MTALPASAGQGRVGRGQQRRVELVLVGGEDQLTGHGDGEVAVLDLHQVHVAELPLVPQEGQVVLVAAGSLHLAGVAEQRAGLAEQVEGDVGQRDVLLDLRCAGDPLPQPLRQDQRVVTEPEHVVGQSGPVRCGAVRCGG